MITFTLWKMKYAFLRMVLIEFAPVEMATHTKIIDYPAEVIVSC